MRIDPSAKVLLMSAYNVADITASGHPPSPSPSLQMRSLKRSASVAGSALAGFPLGPTRDLATIHETKVHWASGILVARLKGWKSEKT